jgi:formamidase
MTRPLGVVMAQVAPVPYDPEATFDKFSREVHVLARGMPQMDLYVFPELYLSAMGSWGDDYPLDWDRRVAEEIPGPTTERLSTLARRVRKWLVPGSVFEKVPGGVANTALAFDPDGRLVATYRKIFPWMPLEHSTPGDSFSTFDIPGVGRFGLMICYDGWFPEVPRTLAWMGAEVILQPTLTKTVDREQEIVLARANAIANQVYIVNPNFGSLFGTGGSVIVDPEGHLLARGGAGEEFLTQVIDLDRVRATREYGTTGLNRMWKQLRDFPPPAFPPYVEGFGAGAVMDGLGPIDDVARPRTAGADTPPVAPTSRPRPTRAADDDGIDPDRISFTRALRAARRSVRAGLGTAARALTVAVSSAIAEVSWELLPTRRLRSAARVVKRKMSNYGVKRPEHRSWPQPTLAPLDAIRVIAPP